MKYYKGGYSNTFIGELLNHKVNNFIFYCYINGITSINKDKNNYINIEKSINKAYNNCEKILTNQYIDYKSSYDFNIFCKLICFLNYDNNKINKNNYGSEAYIIDFLINNKSKSFLSKLNIYLKEFNKNFTIVDDDIITFDNYFYKIGYDICIYHFIYNSNENYKNDFTTLFIDNFDRIIYEINNNFINDFKLIIKTNDITHLFDNSNIKKYLQQCFNLYMYKTKNINNNIINYYKNTIYNFNIPSYIIENNIIENNKDTELYKLLYNKI